MEYSASTKRLIIALTLALVAFNIAMDIRTGFTADHWRSSVPGRF